MAVGLGKNSPIKLRLSRENYEALIERQGSLVRFLKAKKCTCVLKSGRTDSTCPICKGEKFTYSFQKTKKVYNQSCKVVKAGDLCVAMIPDDFGNDFIVSDVMVNNKKLENYSVQDKYIFSHSEALLSHDFVNVNGVVNCELTLTTDKIIYHNSGIFEVLVGVETETGFLGYDITEVVSFKIDGTEVQIKESYRNIITIDDNDLTIDNEAKLSITIKYIPFSKFLVLSQKQNRIIGNILTEVGGDASATIPFEYEAKTDDVITLPFASYIKKDILNRNGKKFDTLPDWYVKDIIEISQNDNILIKGTDYQLLGRNQIRWLSNKIDIGEKFYVEYYCNPSYRIGENITYSIRSSEDQLLPNLFAIKLLNKGEQV